MAMTIPGRPDFWGKLRNAQRQRRTRLGLTLAVWRDRMPAPMLPVDDPVFPFARAILEEVGAWICACAVPLIPFLAEGAAGMVAMERLIRYLPDDLPILLDARWRDPASAGAYLRAAFEMWERTR
jgi:orotidine-5'-phosphate decarboxylase